MAACVQSGTKPVALAGRARRNLRAGIDRADVRRRGARARRALRVMRGLEAGTVWINRYGRTSDFVIPTGGYKQSGIGKDLGRYAYEANLRFKSVLIDMSVEA